MKHTHPHTLTPSQALLCGLLKETTAGLEQKLGGSGKAVREWDRMLAKARYMYVHTCTVLVHIIASEQGGVECACACVLRIVENFVVAYLEHYGICSA